MVAAILFFAGQPGSRHITIGLGEIHYLCNAKRK
jgi:hypothetical protein